MSAERTVVWWEDDPTKTREVVHWCRRCKATPDNYDIVSPGGCAHRGNEWTEDTTHCGADATGLDWWWRT